VRRRAGLPATTAKGGTSSVTTLPAPTTAPVPIVTPSSTVLPPPIQRPADAYRAVGDRVPSDDRIVAMNGVSGRQDAHVRADQHVVLDDQAALAGNVAADLIATRSPMTMSAPALYANRHQEPHMVEDHDTAAKCNAALGTKAGA